MKITKDLIKYDIETAVIVALDAEYKDIQITDGKSYAVVMEGLAKYRELRIKIDDRHKELKKDALEYSRAVDTEWHRLKALLEPGEFRLKEIRQLEDGRKAEIKAEKERKERERIETIQDTINSIRNIGKLHNVASSLIKGHLILIQAMKISEEEYMEFVDQAIQAQWETITSLKEMLAERLQFEKEDAERRAEAERLEIIRGEQAAEQARIDEANRKIQEEKDKLEAEKKAEKKRKDQEEFERAATERAYAYAEQKAKNEAIEKEEKEREEAKEKARQEGLRPDREKLIKFAEELANIAPPDVESDRAKRMALEISNRLNELADNIKAEAKTL